MRSLVAILTTQNKSMKTLYLKYDKVFDTILFILITLLAHKLYWAHIYRLEELSFFVITREFLKEAVFNQSLIILKLLSSQFEYADTSIYLSNLRFVEINEGCSGFKQFYQIILLFLIFPGPPIHKIWYIPAAILIMHFTNVFRIIVLSILLQTNQSVWQFSHDWLLRPFFYLVIFMLWWIWNEKIRFVRPLRSVN